MLAHGLLFLSMSVSYDRCRVHKQFFPTKFYQNPPSGSGEEVENVNC